MTAVKIDDRLTVASQPSRETLSALAAGGFATIINNRPDGEEAGQPGSPAEKVILERAGLAYRFIPVTAATITEAPESSILCASSFPKTFGNRYELQPSGPCARALKGVWNVVSSVQNR